MNDIQLFCGGHQYVLPDGGYNSRELLLIDPPRWGYLFGGFLPYLHRLAFFPLNPLLIHVIDVLGRDLVLFDQFSQCVKKAIDNRLIECLGSLWIMVRGGV
jgi:hypothetical protein